MSPAPLAVSPSEAVNSGRYAAGVVHALPLSQVAELTGMSLRQLRYLAQQNLICPSVRAGSRGAEALYAPADLLALLAVERVRAICGQEVRTERLRAMIDALEAAPPTPGRLLVIDGQDCWSQPGPVDSVVSRSIAALVIELDALRAELGVRLRRAGITAFEAGLAAA